MMDPAENKTFEIGRTDPFEGLQVRVGFEQNWDGNYLVIEAWTHNPVPPKFRHNIGEIWPYLQFFISI